MARNPAPLAIELARWLPESGPDLLEEAARAASWAGDPDRAAAWAADAVAQSDPQAGLPDQAWRLERLGRYRWEAGDPRAAVEVTEQAMALLGDEPPSGPAGPGAGRPGHPPDAARLNEWTHGS